MSEFFTHEMHKEAHDSYILESTPPLTQEAGEGKDSACVEPPRVALTLSNTLVQFLSPLQLQGYTARVIESCGAQHMDELAAQVTCEHDVEKLLGSRASLQQRRELWKGICKWKRVAAKHGREQAKKNNNTNKKIPQCEASSETIVLSKTMITDSGTAHNFFNSDGHTPSQFMRQFAFVGYKHANAPPERQISPQRCSSEPLTSTTTNVVTPSRNDHVVSGIQEGALNSITPHRSASFLSSTNTLFGGSRKDSGIHCHGECVPLASLSVGANLDIIAAKNFAEEWGIPPEEAVPRHSSDSPLVASQTGEDVYEAKLVDTWREEYEMLQKEMCRSLDKSLSAYNEGLQALQDKIHLALEKTPEDQTFQKTTMARELAFQLARKPKLCIELRPITLSNAINVVVNSSAPPALTSLFPSSSLDAHKVVHVTRILPNCEVENLPCLDLMGSETIRNTTRPSSLLNTTVVSSLSGNVGEDAVLLSATEMPSLSDITASERESRRNTEMQVSEDYGKHIGIIPLRDEYMASQPIEKWSSYDSLLHLMSERSIRRRSMSPPSIYNTDGYLLEPLGVGEMPCGVNDDDDDDGNPIRNDELIQYSDAATPPPCNDEDRTENDMVEAQIISSPFSMLSFENFGLTALTHEVGKESVPLYSSTLLDGERHSIRCNEDAQTDVETQVIDVDAISSSEDGETAQVSLLYEDDSGTIPLYEQTSNLGLYSASMMVDDGSSQDDDIGVYTQLSQTRQMAVSRSPPLPTPPESGEDAETGGASFSLTDCATQLDWTSVTDIVADVRNMVSRLQSDKSQTDGTVIGEQSLNGAHNTRDVISSQLLMAPQGLPPLPVRNPTRDILSNCNKTIKWSLTELTPDNVMTMGYKELKKWCKNLGLQIPREEVCANNADDAKGRGQRCQGASSMNLSERDDSRGFKITQEENSSGWWLLNGGGDSVSVISSAYSEEQSNANGDDDDDDYYYYHSASNKNETDEIHGTEGCRERMYTQALGLANDGSMTCTPPSLLLPPLSTTCPPTDADDSEWETLQRAAQVEKLRESLRLFIARRTFMQQVAPSLLQRLPRFSDGRPYKRVRAADLVKTQIALTQQQLEEQRRLARLEEQEEMVRCVIASLAGGAVEGIEQQSLGTMKGIINRSTNRSDVLSTSIQSGSSTMACNTEQPKLALYEQILLMEPTDVQAATALVQTDFPHVSRHRVETLLEESGIPLDSLRPVLHREGVCEMGATQRSASSYSPPPTPIDRQKRQKIEFSQQSKKRFFAQRGWLRREK